MPKTVTARFDSEAAAEQALAAVAAEVPLRDSAVVGTDMAGSLMLDNLHLTPDERSACDQQLAKGGFLLVAQAATESRGEAVLRLLDDYARGGRGRDDGGPAEPGRDEGDRDRAAETAAPPAATSAAAASQPAAAVPAAPPVENEERIPIVEEELRIGKQEVVRGRSRVRTHVAEAPVEEQVELLHEETQIERRPGGRRLTDEEVMEGGLLKERVVEIAEMREEAVVTKEAFIREELVVTKSVHRRVETIEDTVRRTEVETERLPAEAGAASEARGGDPRVS